MLCPIVEGSCGCSRPTRRWMRLSLARRLLRLPGFRVRNSRGCRRRNNPLHRLAKQETDAYRKNRRQSAQQYPFLITQSRGSDLNRWRRSVLVSVIRIRRSGRLRRRRRGSRNRNVKSVSGLHRILRKNVIALLGAGGIKSSAGNLHGWRNHEHHALRIVAGRFVYRGVIVLIRNEDTKCARRSVRVETHTRWRSGPCPCRSYSAAPACRTARKWKPGRGRHPPATKTQNCRPA